MASFELKKGGYDYEFVSPPPKSLECPVCLLTLRDPHVISCCGYEFCQVCIERVQRDGKPCPLCNEQKFSTMLQKKVIREVNALVVRCPQKEQGCGWEGELGQLQQHLNPGPGVSSAQGCQFLTVECAYRCGVQLQRRVIQEHEMEVCPKRPVEMQVASLMKKFEVVITENQMLKQELKKVHQQGLDEVKQELDDLKRAHREQREELRKANEKNDHLQRANQNLQRVCDMLKAEQKQIKTNVDNLEKRKIAALEKKCTSLQTTTMPLPVPPFYVLVTNFDHYRENSHTFVSDPFYSHVGGYKMIAIIRPNGIGERNGTHVSLHVSLFPGEFDDQLRWPFNGRITIQAYNCSTEQWSFERTIEMNARVSGAAAVSRCVDTLSRSIAGFSDFLSFIDREQYLSSGNSLRIRIARIKICY